METLVNLVTCSDLRQDDGTTVRAKGLYASLHEWDRVNLIGGTAGRGGWKPSGRHNDSPWLEPYLDRIRKYAQIYAQLLRKANARGPVLYYLCNDFIDAPACILLSELTGSRFVFEFHSAWCLEVSSQASIRGGNRISLPPRAFHKLESAVASNSDAVVVLNRRTLDHVRNWNDKAFIVPPLLDTSYHFRDEHLRAAMRREMGLDGRIAIGVLGPFTDARNRGVLQSLLLATDQLPSNATVLAIGEKSGRAPVLPHTRYVGYVEDLRPYLSAVDLVVVDPAFPTSGPLNKVLVPMSYSLPVLTTQAGVLGLDYINPGRDLIVAKSSQLAQVLTQLVGDPARMREFGENARTTILEHYSRQVNSPKLRKVVDSFM